MTTPETLDLHCPAPVTRSYRYLVHLEGRDAGEAGEALIHLGRPVVAVIVGASLVAFDVAASGPVQAGAIARRAARDALGQDARITPAASNPV